MSVPRRRLKVGLSAVAVQEDVVGSFWTNGMTQNLIFLALLMQRLRTVDEVFIVPYPDDSRPHAPSVTFGFRQLSLADAVQQLDVFIEVGMRIPTESVEAFQKRGGKFVSYVAGNSFVMNLEALASKLDERAEILPPFEFDAVWITPQHWRTNRAYARLTKSMETHCVGQIWDPVILRHGVSRVAHNFFYKRRLKQGASVGVFEPNVNVLKTFHLPVLVCEALYRRRKDAIAHVYAANTLHLKDNSHFTEFFGSLDLQRDARITAETRFPVYELLGQYVDTVVAHHWENGLNYLYYDVLYGGYPLVHNSEFLRDVGYYFEAFDASSGAAALERAVDSHDEQFDSYQSRSRELLWSVSPDNPALQRQHAELLERLCD
jgi:hypothetical protein